MQNISVNFLLALGFLLQQRGCAYLAFTIAAVADDPAGYYSRTADIFGLLSETFAVNRACALKCMNYAIISAWSTDADNEERARMFPRCGKDFPPSLGEFICRSAFAVRALYEREYGKLPPIGARKPE